MCRCAYVCVSISHVYFVFDLMNIPKTLSIINIALHSMSVFSRNSVRLIYHYTTYVVLTRQEILMYSLFNF